MKVFTGGIVTETNTFAPFATDLDDWQTSDDCESFALKPLLDVVSSAAADRGYEVVQGFGAIAEPAGKTTARAYENLKRKLVESLKDAMPVDLIVLVLHGAMVAENCDDCEGDILRAVREVVSADVPIGVGLDAHAHLSSEMVSAADVLVFMKEWPHTDVEETIENAFRITADFAEGKVNPVMSVQDCHMIAPYFTLREPVRQIVDDMKSAEQSEGILSVSFIHGFWFADVPDMGTKVLVISDNRPLEGEKLAEGFARRLFAIRGNTGPESLTLEQTLDKIEASDKHPIVVADTGDIPGGGAPGDATGVLRGLLERGISNAAVAYIWDPASVDKSIAAGVGAELGLSVGGHACDKSGTPLKLSCVVCGIFPDLVIHEDGHPIRVGDVAVVSTNGIYIGLARERLAAMSSNYFDAMGVDPRSMDVLVIKSANNFYAGFEKIAAEVIYTDAGGVTSGRIQDLDLTRVRRPLWPLDGDLFLK